MRDLGLRLWALKGPIQVSSGAAMLCDAMSIRLRCADQCQRPERTPCQHRYVPYFFSAVTGVGVASARAGVRSRPPIIHVPLLFSKVK